MKEKKRRNPPKLTDKIRLLLTEDDAINRLYLKKILVRKGWDVEEAVDGESALDKMKHNRYDLVLMDIGLPTMSGLEAASQFRKIEALSGDYTPILAVSAYTLPKDIEQCLNAGMDAHISKPISEKQLSQAVYKFTAENSERMRADHP